MKGTFPLCVDIVLEQPLMQQHNVIRLVDATPGRSISAEDIGTLSIHSTSPVWSSKKFLVQISLSMMTRL